MPANGLEFPETAWSTEAEGLGLPIAVCTDAGAIVSLSPMLRDILGLDAPEGERGLEALLTAAGVEQAASVVAACHHDPQSVVLCRGGRRRRLVLRGMRGHDGCLHYSLLPDICPNEQDDRRAQFQSLIAHDIRSPLAVIQGYAGLLSTGQAGPLTGTQREFLQGIDGKITELVRLLDDFLDYQRLEAGAIAMKPEEMDVEELVAQVLDDYESRARRRGLELSLSADPAARRVLADPLRLRQVLDNLISNAVKYTAEGSWIAVSVDAEDNGTRVTVADGGPGLPANQLDCLFEPYGRDDSHRHIAGKGLGLVVVHRLLEAMGATIGVTQPADAGLRFRLLLPTV